MKQLILFPLLMICLVGNAKNYYISQNGNDANNGTSTTTPWKTIAKINSSKFLPGDFIFFKRGNTWREQLTIPSSGSAGYPITFGAYGTGNKPIINAADVTTGWISAGKNIWYINSPNAVTTRAMVSIGGILFTEVNSLSKVNSASKYFIDVSRSPDRLYVYSTVDPSTLTAEISKREYCIVATRAGAIHDINISNIEFRFAGNSGVVFYANSEGPAFNGNCVVDSCSFYACRIHGCVAYDRHSNNVFKNSTADNCGNGFYAWIADDISIINCSTSNSIRHTVAPGNTDGHGYGGYRADDWLVENCVSTNDGGDAINADCGGQVADYIIRYNKVYNTSNAPSMGVGGLALGGVGQVYYNLLVNGGSSTFESFFPNAGKVYIYNNTMYINSSSGKEESLFLAYGANFVLKNNIIYREGGDYKVLLGIQNSGLPTCDYNQFYQTDSRSSPNLFSYNRTNYATLDAWKKASGSDKNSKNANPMFVNVLSDWSLQENSPCINAGTNVGLTRDILGNPIVGLPDIGAFERQDKSGSTSPIHTDFSPPGPGSANGSFTIYPNPVKDFVNVYFSNKNVTTATISICDLSGRTIMKARVMKTGKNFSIPIDIRKFSSGIYSINVYPAGEKPSAVQFLKT